MSIRVRRGQKENMPTGLEGEPLYATDRREYWMGGAGRNRRVDFPAIYPEEYGAKGDGTTDDTAAIQLAVTASANKTLVLSNNYYITSNTTIGSTVSVVFLKGSLITVAAGITVTISGEISAGPYRIFSGSGTISFGHTVGSYPIRGIGSSMTVWAEWFGAVGDNSTDSTASLQSWVNATPMMKCAMRGGIYVVTDEITFPYRWVESELDGQGSQIKYTGSADTSKSIFNINDDWRNNRIYNLSLNANDLAGYCVNAHSLVTSQPFSLNEWHLCYFIYATVANVQLGDQTSSGIDADGGLCVFYKSYFIAPSGSVNFIGDADNNVNITFRDCGFYGKTRGSSDPNYHVKILRGAMYNFDSCFFDRVVSTASQSAGWAVYHASRTIRFSHCDSEEGNFLYVGELTNSRKYISIDGLTISDSSLSDGDYCIYALDGLVSLRSVYASGASKRIRVRCDDTLLAENVWLGSYISGSSTYSARAGEYLVGIPSRSEIEGFRLSSVKASNPNPHMSLWPGSAEDDLPIGYIKSTQGTLTVTKNGDTSSSWSTSGKYTAKVDITVGEEDENYHIDGLKQRTPFIATGPSQTIVFAVSGYCENLSGATMPRVELSAYYWTGSAWSSAIQRVRDCTITAGGKFYGIDYITIPSNRWDIGYIEATAGLGVDGASGTLYISQFCTFPMEGENYSESGGSERPELATIKAILGESSDYIINGSFASTNWWTTTGWSVADAKATHSAGNTTPLYQTVGSIIKSKRGQLMFSVSGMTAGSVVASVAGTDAGTVSADGSYSYYFTAGSSDGTVKFTPSTDFDGSVTNVECYIQRGGPAPSTAGDWDDSGYKAFGDNGVNIVSSTNSNINPHLQYYESAAPTSGTWKLGDIVWNDSPASNKLLGWQCTTAGTPGTWESITKVGCVNQDVQTTASPTLANLTVQDTSDHATVVTLGESHASADTQVIVRGASNSHTLARAYTDGSLYTYLNGTWLTQLHADSSAAYWSVHNNSWGMLLRVLGNGNVGLGQTSFGANATYTLAQKTGVAPTGSPVDCYQQYSADIASGNAAPHFRTEAGDIVKLYKQAHEADLKTDYTTGDLDSEAKIITALNATNTKINALMAKIENTGLLASA